MIDLTAGKLFMLSSMTRKSCSIFILADLLVEENAMGKLKSRAARPWQMKRTLLHMENAVMRTRLPPPVRQPG